MCGTGNIELAAWGNAAIVYLYCSFVIRAGNQDRQKRMGMKTKLVTVQVLVSSRLLVLLRLGRKVLRKPVIVTGAACQCDTSLNCESVACSVACVVHIYSTFLFLMSTAQRMSTNTS